jgi:hypothetical protein
MNSLKYGIAFVVAPLFFLAAATKLRNALQAPEQRRILLRHSVLYCLAGLAWLLFAFGLRTQT